MVAAREMGMSEQEFMNANPVFFAECYEIFNRKKREEVSRIYGR